MGSTRRSYTPEYKASSVALVIDGGCPVAEVARNIGVHEMTLSTLHGPRNPHRLQQETHQPGN
jgi:transposase-like protein